MNILLFAYDFEQGGIARTSQEVASGLGRLGHKVFVVSDFARKIPGLTGREAFTPLSFRKKNLRSLSFWLDFFPLRVLLKRLSIDMLFLGALFPYGPMAWLLSRTTRIPYAVIIYGAELFVRKSRTRRIVSGIFAKASHIVCVSEFTRRTLLQRFPRSRDPVVIPAGAPLEDFAPAADRPALLDKYGLRGKRVILTVARLVRRKGHAQVIRALPRLLDRVPHLVYVIAGSGPTEDELRALVRRMRLDEHVRFVGYASGKRLVDLYRLCDVFVLPSRDTTDTESGRRGVEGFPLAYVEASACGRPIVAGKSGGSAEAVLDGVTGLLVDGESVEQIGDALLQLLFDEELANRLGQNGKKRVEKEFSWDAIVRRIEEEICG